MMKRKKILALSSLCLATTMLASCAGLSSMVSFNDYWQSNPDANLTNFSETLAYSVTYEPQQGLASGYDLNYSNGAYTTNLQLITENGKSFYKYSTEFSITASYTYESETALFQDTIQSWVLFEKSANNLQPIASHKKWDCHSPANVSAPTKLEDCYSLVRYTVDTTYESDLSSGKALINNLQLTQTNNKFEYTFEIDDDKARYVDNEQIYLALRAVNTSSSTAPNFLVYAPFTNAVQGVSATYTSEEAETITFIRNGSEVSESVECYSVSLKLTEKNPGAAQTIWLAKKTDNSKMRNVIFKMETPLSYSMGTLVYKLTSETFEEKTN